MTIFILGKRYTYLHDIKELIVIKILKLCSENVMMSEKGINNITFLKCKVSMYNFTG
jgi:hypothetical protein